MRRFALLLLFILVFATGAIYLAPLSLLVRTAELPAMGVGWQQARGTIWDGQLVGLDFHGEPIGSASLKSTPLNFLLGRPVHQVRWLSGPSRAVADISPSRTGLSVENLSADILIKQFASGIASSYSINTAHIRLNHASALYSREGCVSFSGAISSDVLQELGGGLGTDFPELVGTLICDNRVLKAHLEGKASDGTMVRLDILQGRSATLALDNISQEAAFALTSAGFDVSGTHFEHVIPLTEGN